MKKEELKNVKKTITNAVGTTKGITLIALVVTISVILILSAITIKLGTQNLAESGDDRLNTELGIVQHAILERYTKASLTGESLPGTQATNEQINKMVSVIGNNKKDTNTSNYYVIDSTNASNLGITNIEYEYIVNYITGEVFNLTKETTSTGEPLYIYAKSN